MAKIRFKPNEDGSRRAEIEVKSSPRSTNVSIGESKSGFVCVEARDSHIYNQWNEIYIRIEDIESFSS